MPHIPLCIVDAFADRPFTGNPAAVCLLDPAAVDPSARWMQSLASEMNLSETAFVRPLQHPPERGSGNSATVPSGAYALRWFTPAAEVELCGHATLAAAHLLWETGRAHADHPITFHTRHRGPLICTPKPADESASLRGWGAAPFIAMDFPADPATPAPAPPALLAAVHLAPGTGAVVATARSRYDWVVELNTPDAVRAASPDFAALAQACEQDNTRGLALTARGMPASAGMASAPPEPDIVSRFFAPRLRVNEDPVTGSLHCTLAPYWSPRLGKQALRCHQASPRGGTILTTLDPTRPDRVTLAGRAVTVVRGEVAME